MAEQKEIKDRPELLSFIEDKLDGENKQSLLEFIKYCKENKMSVKLSSGYIWSIHFKAKRVASIEITVKDTRRGQYTHKDDSWIINVCYLDIESPEFDDFVECENLSETIWKNISFCKGCLKACIGNQPPGLNKKIAGKAFDKVSACGYIKFKNPDSDALTCVKKMMELRKKDILANK